MALESDGCLDLTFTAENDLSANQYHWVELSGTFQVDVPDAETDTLLGILQNKPLAGGAAHVRVEGVSKLVCDGSVSSAGMRVGSTTTGHGKVKSADRATAGAIALEGSSTNGVLLSVLLTPTQTLSA